MWRGGLRMSNDPVSKAPVALAAPDLGTATGVPSGETEKVLAALARMEDALRSDGGALDRVRTDLAEMASALAQAKSALDANNPEAADRLGSLLRTLEGRLGSLVDLVGAASAQVSVDKAAAETGQPPPPQSDALQAHGDPDRVPTVSNVVSRLGRAEFEGFRSARLAR